MSRPPLPDRVRPRDLDAIVGQERWLAPGAPLRRALDAGELRSVVLWGPPGCGKTTLARAIQAKAGLPWARLSAVLDGVKELREVLAGAEARRKIDGKPTLLFVDEIHRWNKAQQDALLPEVEAGGVVLVGATTENPSFYLNAALRSRVLVVRLEPLDEAAIAGLLRRALADPHGLAGAEVPDDVVTTLARLAAGDARRALDDLERVVTAADGPLTPEGALRILERQDVRHDRDGDDHYDVVSALIKSMRGSDPDAALYWLARMLQAGEDPRFVARRLVIFAAEDVGLADPRALQVAIAAAQATEWVGMPEARIPLAEATVWLATSPKSNSAYLAIDQALDVVKARGALPVPLHLRNAPTKGMKDEGFGQGYLYPHDHPHRIVDQAYLPDALRGARFYTPSGMGEEKTIADRMAWWQRKLGR